MANAVGSKQEKRPRGWGSKRLRSDGALQLVQTACCVCGELGLLVFPRESGSWAGALQNRRCEVLLGESGQEKEESCRQAGALARFGDRISSVPPDALNPRMVRAGLP